MMRAEGKVAARGRTARPRRNTGNAPATVAQFRPAGNRRPSSPRHCSGCAIPLREPSPADLCKPCAAWRLAYLHIRLAKLALSGRLP